jgi:MFS family permease
VASETQSAASSGSASGSAPADGIAETRQRRTAVLRDARYRRFFAGYTTSELGSSMSPLAITFAVLGRGDDATELGLVMTARITPLVLCLLGGGLFADRRGSRLVMLTADTGRCVIQAVFALALFTGHASLWTLLALSAASGVAEGFFMPAQTALIPRIAPGRHLTDANALLSMANSATSIAGPLLAGIVVAAAGPAVVLLVDAATYGVSVLALSGLKPSAPPVTSTAADGADSAARRSSLLTDLREGWSEFRSRSWLWATSVQFALFNFFVWAPYLVLGPATAQQRLGGARAWSLVMGGLAAGAIVGGLALLGRRPRRPIAMATLLSLGYVFPPAALALRLPLAMVVVAAAITGVTSSMGQSMSAAAQARLIPPDALARVTAFDIVTAFALGPIGLAVAGPVAAAVGTRGVFAFGACWQVVSVAAVIALPTVRRIE